VGISQEGHVGVGADRFLLFFFKANGLPASWLHINRKQFPQLMWACCGFPCVCMCVSCSDSQQDSLITEESKGCIFLIQKLDTWDSGRYFKKEIQNDDAHLLGPYIKKGVWVEKKKWRRLDHYCLWGHEHKGMVLLFYVKKKKKKRERERLPVPVESCEIQPLQVSAMPSSQPQEIFLRIFIIQSHITPDHKRKLCA